MTLRIPAKVLIHVWSHDVIDWKTATSYDTGNTIKRSISVITHYAVTQKEKFVCVALQLR